MPGFVKESRGRRRSWVALAGALAVVAAVAAALVTTSASARVAAAAKATQACGQDVSYADKIKDPDGVFKKLPPAIQARYGPWPYQVRSTPWEAFKGVKKPWKIGLITFPVGSPWLAVLTYHRAAEVPEGISLADSMGIQTIPSGEISGCSRSGGCTRGRAVRKTPSRK